jgi:hypothetical protein
MFSVVLASVTVTEVTGAAGALLTVTATLAVFPSMFAITVVEPAPIALRTPDELTDATAGFRLDHVAARPGRMFSFASSAVA